MIPNFSFSADIAIFGTILACLLGGMFLSQQRVKVFALSLFVGMVLSIEFTPMVSGFLSAQGGFLASDGAQLALFVLPALLLTLGRRDHPIRGQSRLLTVFLAVAAAGLAVTTGLSVLTEATRQQVLLDSNTASQLYNLRNLWLLAVPAMVIASSLFQRRDPRH